MTSTETLKRPAEALDIQWVGHILNHLRPTLPIQNPMPFFVHNNPLQYWEQFPFAEGMENAILTYENSLEQKSRIHWRELEDFVLPIVIAYFDQGLSRWNLEEQKQGLWKWFGYAVQSSWDLKGYGIAELKLKIKNISENKLEDAITEVLRERCPNKENWSHHLQTLIFHFKGWSGMIQVLEKNPALFPLVARPTSFTEWVAILVFAEQALNAQKEKPWWGQALWKQELLEARQKEIPTQFQRLRSQELLFYRSFLQEFKSHVAQQSQKKKKSSATQTKTSSPAQVQLLLCLDDREESLRRHLEEVGESTGASYETFGTLGFFGLDFSVKRPGHLIFQHHCPPVIASRKKAEEHSTTHSTSSASRGFRLIKFLLPHLNESRFTFWEPFLALLFWPIYAFLLFMRSYSPQWYHQWRENLRHDHYLSPHSSIQFIEPYTNPEKATIVAGILGSIGLLHVRAPLVVALGHAATTTNNPFQKSYGCGACSGQAGFSNAKVFAEFANDPEVRKELLKKDILIENHVTFLAACHDTCRDEVIYATQNEELLQKDQHKQILFKQLQKDLKVALERNLQERQAQFELPASLPETKQRGLDWSQPRPEFGHTEVALAIFGPRWLTQNLNLKRRAFLNSYEPDLDPKGEHLTFNILNALPVCANINLDYFTSSAFPEAFGAGSKLPLNIASGIGVMPGSKGDLCIGLATQMVDRHQPLRLLSIIYCERSKLTQALSASARLQNIIKNNWIHLIRMDPYTHQMELLTDEFKEELKDVL